MIELCYPVEVPAGMWAAAGVLTEAGELALQAMGAEVEQAAERAAVRYGLRYTRRAAGSRGGLAGTGGPVAWVRA